MEHAAEAFATEDFSIRSADLVARLADLIVETLVISFAVENDIRPLQVFLIHAVLCICPHATRPDCKPRVLAVKTFRRWTALLVHGTHEENAQAPTHSR